MYKDNMNGSSVKNKFALVATLGLMYWYHQFLMPENSVGRVHDIIQIHNSVLQNWQ